LNGRTVTKETWKNEDGITKIVITMTDGNKKYIEKITRNPKTGEKINIVSELYNLEESNFLIQLYLVIQNYLLALFVL